MNMHHKLENLVKTIDPLRQQIINHPVYAELKAVEDLQIFMEFHIYAVWDFMSLLKALQQNLTCVSIPWFPVGDPVTRQLINEIVLGEESDVDADGHKKSHYELYLEAMQQCGANTTEFRDFAETIQKTGDFTMAYQGAQTPIEAKDFVNFTFETIQTGAAYLQAAVFTFGREDLIPKMFYSMVEDISATAPDRISILKYYLERHIEVDGDHHSGLALEMTRALCGDDDAKWEAATAASIQALKMRIRLWDGALRKINERKFLAK